MSGKSNKQKQVPKKVQKITQSPSSGKGKQREKEREQLQNEFEKLEKTMIIYRNNLDPLTEELHQYTSRDTIERTPSGKEKQRKRDTEELQNEIEKLKERIFIYRNNLDPFKIRKVLDLTEQSMVNILTDENLRLTEELHKYNLRDTRERSNHDEVLQQKASEINALKEEVKELSRKLTEFKDIKTELQNAKKSVEEKDKQIQEMIKEKTNIETEKNKLEHECESIREQLKIREIQLEDLKKNSSNSDESLSKFVGANIMNDNPNITDLSDENRPTKLSEKHCELYDNEWTDAYEEAENEFKTEEKGIAHLYKTLQDVSDFCKKKSVEHEENIRNSIMTLPNSSSARPKSAKIGAINQHQLKEVRKSFAPMLVESVFQNYVHEKKLNFTKKENIRKFIKKCVEICWLMNSQNPPVIFDTSDVDGKSFDVDKFRTYTKTGKLVDYVVWPSMLLHKGGPMLCKGVAQGK